MHFGHWAVTDSTTIYLKGGSAEKRISVREWDEQSITVKYFGISVDFRTLSSSTATDLPLKCIETAFTWGAGRHRKLTGKK